MDLGVFGQHIVNLLQDVVNGIKGDTQVATHGVQQTLNNIQAAIGAGGNVAKDGLTDVAKLVGNLAEIIPADVEATTAALGKP